MAIKNSRAELISDYLREHKSAELDRKEPFEIAGKRVNLAVIRLPLDKLYYNIKNGRFAAELHELEASEGRRLEPEKPKDALKIEELLLKDQTRTDWLKKDIIRVGQLQPATITDDGYIVNGNRRAAILNQLYREKGDARYSFLEAVRLPPDVSPQDLWRFEAGFQLAVELKADYGPVNELLKIKEGQEYGLHFQEIALILGGDNTTEDVEQKLRVLRLVEDYLRYFGQDNRYSLVERRVEHFINLDNIMHRSQWKKLNPDQEDRVLHSAYHLIHDADIAHLQIRSYAHLVKEPQIAMNFANEILIASGVLKESNIGKKAKATSLEKKKEPISLEPSEEELKKLEEKLLSPPPESIKNTKDTDENNDEKNFEVPAKATKSAENKEKLKEKLREILETTVEKVALNQQIKKPSQIFKRIETNLLALNEIPLDHLKPHKKEFNHLEKLVTQLAKKFR